MLISFAIFKNIAVVFSIRFFSEERCKKYGFDFKRAAFYYCMLKILAEIFGILPRKIHYEPCSRASHALRARDSHKEEERRFSIFSLRAPRAKM